MRRVFLDIFCFLALSVILVACTKTTEQSSWGNFDYAEACDRAHPGSEDSLCHSHDEDTGLLIGRGRGGIGAGKR